MLAALQSGDEIVTTGGIYGTITNVKDDRFVVRVADNTKIEVGKGFVQTVLNRKNAAATTEKK
jgi:preprotein translocase subunit YajC